MNTNGRHNKGNWIKHWIWNGRCVRPGGVNSQPLGKPWGKGGWWLGGGGRWGNGRPHAPPRALPRPAEHD